MTARAVGAGSAFAEFLDDLEVFGRDGLDGEPLRGPEDEQVGEAGVLAELAERDEVLELLDELEVDHHPGRRVFLGLGVKVRVFGVPCGVVGVGSGADLGDAGDA